MGWYEKGGKNNGVRFLAGVPRHVILIIFPYLLHVLFPTTERSGFTAGDFYKI